MERGSFPKGLRLYNIMTQDEQWHLKCKEIIAFIERECQNPSKHRIEEHDMLN